MYELRDRCLALAGTLQGAALAASIARNGVMDVTAAENSIRSILRISAATTEDVFDGVEGVHYGLRRLHQQLGNRTPENLELFRYVVYLLMLERKLVKQPQMLDTLSSGIALATARLEHFSPLHSNILAQLAELYSTTISTLTPRIMVQGEPLHLANPENVNRIRALLLAGIRSARLFHQLGGRRYHLIFRMEKYREQAAQILNEG